MLKTSVLCFLASYGCAFLLELAQLKWKHTVIRLLALLMAAAGLVAQTFYLLNRSQETELAPLLSSAHDWLLVLGWIVVLVYLFVSLVDSQLTTGLLIWPIVMVLVVAAQYAPRSRQLDIDYLRGWKMLHASMLVLGTTGILLGFVLSLLYLWQYRRLKHHQMMGSTVKLPNLELIERLNRWSILAAVPLLTIGVVTGFGLTIAPHKTGLAILWEDPVIIGGGITWTLMGILFFWLLTHKSSPGRQVAKLTVWSCGFLLAMLVGLQVLVSAVGTRGLHGAPAGQIEAVEKQAVEE